ncbi:unnamed protein product, partial [Didymodactylos carnosus]
MTTISANITTWNDLAVEFYLDLFEYFDLQEILMTFWNISQRMNNIITNSHLHLSLDLSLMTEDKEFKQICSIIENNICPSQLISIQSPYAYHHFKTKFNFHKFNCLRSLTIWEVDSNEIDFILSQLSKLEYLSVLIYSCNTENTEFSHFFVRVLQMFTLRKLRLLTTYSDDPLNLTLPLTTRIQSSNIEYLTIETRFDLQLLKLFPKLRYLNISMDASSIDDANVEIITLFDLTTLILHLLYDGTFNDLRLKLLKLAPNIRTLNINGKMLLNDLNIHQLSSIMSDISESDFDKLTDAVVNHSSIRSLDLHK